MAAYDVIERYAMVDGDANSLKFLGWYHVFADVAGSRARFMEAGSIMPLDNVSFDLQAYLTDIVRESSAKVFDVSAANSTGGTILLSR